MTKFVYCVYCEDKPEAACFETEAEAMELARTYANCYVEKNEIDEDGNTINTEVIYEATTADAHVDSDILVDDNPFDTEFPKSDVEDISEIDDEEYEKMYQDYLDSQEVPADWDDPNRFPPKKEDLNIKEAVKNLEEHEDEVECKCCFDLFPKADCVKTEDGYVCKKCDQELHSHQGTNLDLIDADPFDLDYDDPRDPEEIEEPEIKEEPVDETEIRKHEKAIEEESLEEHIQDGAGTVESEQVLQGIDNAVVNCKTDHKIIAHSEDEKPLDCKMEKPALEEPLAGKEVDIKINEDTDIKDLSSQQKNDVIVDIAKSLADKDVNTVEAGITREQGGIAYENEKVQDIKKAIFEESLTEAEIKELDEDLKSIQEELVEAKKDEEELPVDPEAVKLEVHQELNDLVADEIEAINGYDEAKADILDAPIEHKDAIIDTLDHIKDEEKEHIDELIDATTEIPFDKGHEAPVVEEPVAEPEVIPEEPIVEEELNEDPFDQDFPKNEEKPLVEVAAPTPFDSDIQVGDKIKIGHLEGEDNSYDGKEGEVTHIDDIGQLHGTWGGLALIPGVDEFEVIKEECLKEDISADNFAKAEQYLKTKDDAHKWIWFDIEWEDDQDICGASIEWDEAKNKFVGGLSIYHASEDNNAEYPEKHTDEIEVSGSTLKELYDKLSDDYGKDFIDAFEAELRSKKLLEASSAEKKAFKNGGEDYNDLINGTAIGMIKDPKARAAAVAALKAGRKDLLKAYIGDRHENAAVGLLDKKQNAMANAGMTDESLKEEVKEDEVECGWCHEHFPESDCRFEKDFGHLCPGCENELKSRGETLEFVEPTPKEECLHENEDPNKEVTDVINSWSMDSKSPTSAKGAEDKEWDEVKDAIIKDVENARHIEKAELTPEEAAKAAKKIDDIIQGWN